MLCAMKSSCCDRSHQWILLAAILIAGGAVVLSSCDSRHTASSSQRAAKALAPGETTDSASRRGDSVALAPVPRRRADDGLLPRPGQPDGESEDPSPHQPSTEAYDRIYENAFLFAARNPVSTFSIDVDTASYSNVRRFLNEGQLPPRDAVRIEELVNYFHYDYPQPGGDHPVAVALEAAACPWNAEHRLVRIGVQGKKIAANELPRRNFVFLIDVSGSMQPANKLPLVKQSLTMLAEQLTDSDRVAIVVYAGRSGLVLPPTSGRQKHALFDALARLDAGGSTNGGEGIRLAYATAEQAFIDGGLNRVILCTDGDFNVGVTSQSDLLRLIEEKRKSGVFLSVFGFGMGNLKDSTMEKLADHGNGHYAYIDSLAEARKVFVEEAAGLIAIAKDVKIQVEFNPKKVAAYRLVGYENRLLGNEDFANDAKDAGDMGAGHTVTAFYEIIPASNGRRVPTTGVAPLGSREQLKPALAAGNDELLRFNLRYKAPDGDVSKLLSVAIADEGRNPQEASPEFRFASAVASFGMLLRDSEYKGDASFSQVLEMARSAKGQDKQGHRAEFIKLIGRADMLAKVRSAGKPQVRR